MLFHFLYWPFLIWLVSECCFYHFIVKCFDFCRKVVKNDKLRKHLGKIKSDVNSSRLALDLEFYNDSGRCTVYWWMEWNGGAICQIVGIEIRSNV